jgi:hypothetical protein
MDHLYKPKRRHFIKWNVLASGVEYREACRVNTSLSPQHAV